MISIYNILKEVISPSQEYQELVNDIVDQGGEFLGEGDYGAVFLVGDRVKKVTTDSEELEDAQQIKGQKTKYFVYIYDVEVRSPKLGIITMDNLEPFTGSEKDVPIDDIMEEATLNLDSSKTLKSKLNLNSSRLSQSRLRIQEQT